MGHDLVLLPSVSVLVWGADEQLLLVRELETGLWQTIGGALEPDETPQQGALREAQEEAAIVVELTRIRAVLGGPSFHMRYPNGDEVAYVATVFDAHLSAGTPCADREETSDVGWFSATDLLTLEITPFTRSLLSAVGVLPSPGANG